MPKADFEALLEPGIHHHTLYNLAVLGTTWVRSERRSELLKGFAAFLHYAMGANLSGMDLWVNGSFVTKKDEPDDIDCVLWVTKEHVENCSPTDYDRLTALLDRGRILYKYRVDLYIGDPSVPSEVQYWESKFGTCHDQVTKKGFVSLTI